MSDQPPPEWAEKAALEGSHEAAAWALRLLEGGAPAAAGDLYRDLQAMDLAKAEVFLSQLVNLTAQLAVKAGDIEKLKAVLRVLRRG